MPAEVYSLHGSGASGLASAKAEKKRVLKYEKNLKRPVDTNAPKKPLSAYFQWMASERPKVAKDTTNVAEITKKLGDMWRTLDEKEKKTWEDKSKKQMEIYKRLMAAYKLTSEHEDYEKSLREFEIKKTYKPFKKDENMPKKAMSAYMVFQSEKRAGIVAKNPDAKVTEIMGMVAAAWKELSEKAKEPFVKKAKKLAEKRAKEVEKYMKSEQQLKYLAEKKEYEQKMKARRIKLEKQGAKAEEGPVGKSSGESPAPKRRKTQPKKASQPKKKTSSKKKSPKKKDSKKKSQPKKAKTSSKKKSQPKAAKKKSAPKMKKKVASKKKKSPKKKAVKARKAKSTDKK